MERDRLARPAGHRARREGFAEEPAARLIVESSREGVCALDRHGRFAFVDDWLAAMLGYRRRDIEGRPLQDFAAGDVSALIADMLCTQRMGDACVELALRHRSGRRVYVVIDSTPTDPEDGGDAGVLAVVSDVSDRKQTELRLAATEHFAQAISETTADGVIAIDHHGVVAFMNSAAERALGWLEHELVGRTMHDATHFQHKDGSPYPARDCPILASLRGGRAVQVDDDVFTRRDGTLLPVSYRASPLVREGSPSGAVVAFRDQSGRAAAAQRARDEHDTALWVERIRAALHEDRFVLYGQPIFDLRTGEVAQTELLIRMRERDGEIVGPGVFLSVAERYGLIGEIDAWVVGQAARLAARGMRVQVNVSAGSLGPGLLATVEEELRASGAAPDGVVFEVTETAVMENPDDGAAFARRLTELGCGFALDDFGTGYGSFTYLKRLPVRQLKIDIEFVRNLVTDVADQHVVRAIVSLARGFGQQTVAEGVEDERTLELLRDFDVDYAQGFHLARPAEIASTETARFRRY